jgi:isoleucyl-tRNA synthetase
VNRLQNIRKDKGFDVTDKIGVKVLTDAHTKAALNSFNAYIRSEILAETLVFAENLVNEIELEEINCKIEVNRI